METLIEVLAVAGAVATGLPVLLRAIKLILLAIPKDQGEDKIEKIAVAVEKFVAILTGFKKIDKK